jgi:four helix bundle protein
MGERIERFEDLIAWQRARELTKDIYRIAGQGEFQRDFGLRDQVRRASVSIMSNIAEGFERGSRSEFHQFFVIAKGSCAELRSQLYVALDVDYIDIKTFSNVSALAKEVGRLVGGLRAAVYRQKVKTN